jgi:hypothetical protein
MSWSKRELVTEAFSELALAGFVFDLAPEELQAGLKRLDNVVATLEGRGVRLGYPLHSTPGGSDLDEDSNLPAYAVAPIYQMTALALCATFGKVPTPTLKAQAADGLNVLLSKAAMPAEQQFRDGMPFGAGNKLRGREQVFTPEPDLNPLSVNSGGDLDILGG